MRSGWHSAFCKTGLQSQTGTTGTNSRTDLALERISKMTADELKTKFPNASDDFIRSNAEDSSRDQRDRKSAVVQGSETSVRVEGQKDRQNNGKANHAARAPRVDAESSSTYRVTITLRFSDRRRIDADGCTATLFDCLITARRLLDGDPRALRKMRTVRKWKRRSNDRDREADVTIDSIA